MGNNVKEILARHKAAKASASAPAVKIPEPVPKAGIPVKLKVIGTTPVARSCGHPESFNVKENEPEDRLLASQGEFTGKTCQRCRDAVAQAEAAERRKNLPARSRSRPRTRLCALCQEGNVTHRVPIGAVFSKQYVAESLWRGSFTLASGVRYEAEASGSFALERKLDRMWQDAVFQPGQRPYEHEEKAARKMLDRIIQPETMPAPTSLVAG